MNRKKIIFIVLAAVAIVGISIGYYLYNKPPADVAGMEPEYTLPAGRLAQEYQQNEQAANEKYLDKIIQVQGTITDIMKNDTTIAFILGEDDGQAGGINCSLSPNETENARAYQEGDEVTVKGKCTGKLFEVVLINCYIQDD